MGYVPEDDTEYHLTFADKYPGLEVTMTGLTVGEMIDSIDVEADLDALAGAVSGSASMQDPDTLRAIAKMSKSTKHTFDTFADHLISWNIERNTDKGRVKVPPTLEGIRTQKATLIRDIIRAWRSAITDVPAPLEPPSSDGATSLALSLPMDVSLPNPAN